MRILNPSIVYCCVLPTAFGSGLQLGTGRVRGAHMLYHVEVSEWDACEGCVSGVPWAREHLAQSFGVPERAEASRLPFESDVNSRPGCTSSFSQQDAVSRRTDRQERPVAEKALDLDE